MRVTFDSNAYQRVVDPSQFQKDRHLAAFQAIHTALRSGRVMGLLSETVATLEGIQKAQRGPYFSNMKPKIDVQEEELPDGTIKLGFVVRPNDGLHPGLHPILIQWLNAAGTLGIKFMRAPRIGTPRPSELLRDVYDAEADEGQSAQRQGRFFDLEREIERRGVGIAVVKGIGNQINVRLGVAKPWFASLDTPKDAQEESQIKKAVAEWADGDTVAAHYGYENKYLCSEDEGNSAGATSIFDSTNRAWLEATYGLKIVTLSELAGKL
ncbi:MAG: hypothetical protein HYX67_10885 [Candidatus Melainabacteria bacterium]|nr:hypothetical protein [Candidatus Melainabacteria bacterium]